MTICRVRVLSTDRQICDEVRKDTSPLIMKKVVGYPPNCMGIQCFTVERLREEERGPGMMDSLAELDGYLKTIDLTPEDSNEIARILDRLRDELKAAS